MPDPFRKVTPGEPVTFSATAYNAMLDAARQAAQRIDATTERTDQRRSGDIVRIKNESGSDLPRYSVLGISGPIFDPTTDADAFLREVALRGVVPTASHKGKFAVTLEPAPAGQVVRAHVGGICPVLVEIADEAHTCADVSPGSTDGLITAADGSARLLWADGEAYYGSLEWGLIRFGAGCGTSDSGSATLERCDCPEDDYEIEVTCGPCRIMPKYWWLDIVTSVDSAYAYECAESNCNNFVGQRVRLENVAGEYQTTSCTWRGSEGLYCALAELTIEGEVWVLRVYDSSDCLLYEGEIALDAFVCCGTNDGWTQVDGACTMDVTLEPDPCTCCPPLTETCPPDGMPVCEATDCCLEGICDINALVSNGVNSGNEDPTADCTTLDAYYAMTWVSPCTWRSPLDVNNTYAEMILTAPFTWTLKVYGPAGQVATYRLEEESCISAQTLIASGLSIPFIAAESTCPVEFGVNAEVDFPG